MTQTQCKALALMASENVGAVVTSMGWTWRQDVRESDEAAEAVLRNMRRNREE